jgi:transposase
MIFIEGTDREQVIFTSLEGQVSPDSIVRIIDRFIEGCDLGKMGFTRAEPRETGRHGYSASMLAKLYVYGYFNGIRSSRLLQRETEHNAEVKWLTRDLRPSYKTIAEFRRLNIRPLQKLFHEFVKLCELWDLVGGELFATDGAKIRASNNKKSNFSKKKLADRLTRIDAKIDEYLTDIDTADRSEEANQIHAPEELLELLARRELYEGYLAQLDETGENEVSTVDPDARLMGNNRGGVEVAYNAQSTVDALHHIVVDYDVSMNPSDQGQLARCAKRLIRRGYRRFTILADKGYYNGEDLRRLKRYKVKAVVARQKPSNLKGQPKQFHTEQFCYDAQTDRYRCPMGELLLPQSRKTAKLRRFYNKKACAICPHVIHCTRGESGYRTITRSVYSEIYEEADRVYMENLELYKQRQQIVEHPFGTIKHTMHGDHFLLRTRRKVRCEYALLLLGYNLKRAYSVLGFREIMDRLGKLLRFHDALCAFICAFRYWWTRFGDRQTGLLLSRFLAVDCIVLR